MILAFETSGTIGSVALCEGETVRGSRSFDTQQEAVRRLPLAVQELRRAAQGPVQGLAVSRGPGSFNGLRVGIALAKAMAHAWRTPVAGIPTPVVWAAESAARFPGHAVAVLQPSRREHVYLTIVAGGKWRVAKEEERPEMLRGPEVVEIADLGSALAEAAAGSGPLVLTGDWAELEGWAEGRMGILVDVERAVSPSAVTVARLAGSRLARCAEDSYYTLRPEYVSPSQAERNWGVNLGL